MRKSAKAVSVIADVDGPTSVFLLRNDKSKLTLKQRIHRFRYGWKKKRVEKIINASEHHTMEEVLAFATNELIRIVGAYNISLEEQGADKEMMLPHLSCHSLRHTYATILCERGVNVKVMQMLLGHRDISTTMDIYTKVSNLLRLKT